MHNSHCPHLLEVFLVLVFLSLYNLCRYFLIAKNPIPKMTIKSTNGPRIEVNESEEKSETCIGNSNVAC